MNKIDIQMSGASPRPQDNKGIVFSRDVEDMRAILSPSTAMVCWDRTIPSEVQDWIDRLDPALLPRARMIVPTAWVRKAVTEALDEASMPEGPGRAFLIDDIAQLAARFTDLMETSYIRVRLNAVDNNSCRKFHVDSVKARMVCTYRGLGTQYGFSTNGEDPQDIFVTKTGMPLLLRGLLWREEPASGLVHRSPPIEGTGETRLVLVLDPIDDPTTEE